MVGLTAATARHGPDARDRQDTLARHAATVRSLLDHRFAVAVAEPGLCDADLFAEERAHIAGAVARRRAEWGTVRVCARRALAELGVPARPLLPNADRSPRWPPLVRGSLSHGAGLCLAAVTRDPLVASVGIDVEGGAPLDDGLEEIVCTAAERAWLAGQNRYARGHLGKVFFSAKEAFYKCQYGITGAVLDFPDVELRLDTDRSTFTVIGVASERSLPRSLGRIAGRYACADGRILSTAVILDRAGT